MADILSRGAESSTSGTDRTRVARWDDFAVAAFHTAIYQYEQPYHLDLHVHNLPRRYCGTVSWQFCGVANDISWTGDKISIRDKIFVIAIINFQMRFIGNVQPGMSCSELWYSIQCLWGNHRPWNCFEIWKRHQLHIRCIQQLTKSNQNTNSSGLQREQCTMEGTVDMVICSPE